MQQRLTTTPSNQSFKEAAFVIGVQTMPSLADHGFHDLVVLPGAFYLAAALTAHREQFGPGPRALRQVQFQNPVILSKEDAQLSLRTRTSGPHSRIEYTFFEASHDGVNAKPDGTCAARLEIATEKIEHLADQPPDLLEFQRQATHRVDGDELYRLFEENGNQYRGQFQRIASTWFSGRRVLAQVVQRPAAVDFGQFVIDPILVDAMIQVLGATALSGGRTFVLKSIDAIEIDATELPENVWVLATQHDAPEQNDRVSGEIAVFDSNGKRLIELHGVACGLLQAASSASRPADAGPRWCISSTFTAEPLEESIRFWGEAFGTPVAVEFAPYNQVFQELLGSNTHFQRNQNGANVLLLGLEDWLNESERATLIEGSKLALARFGAQPPTVLPNGLQIIDLNSHETDYVYKEIFQDRCYLRHGITLNDTATVIDIGANIGLFSLFVLSECAAPTIYAFEPSPTVFQRLEANLAVHGRQAMVKPLNCGVADRAKTAEFTFYENASVFSSFHPNASEDQDAIEAVVRNVLEKELAGEDAALDSFVEELTANRLRRRTCECQLISISDIITRNHIKHIDLLKIDAEKSELEILRGIREEHWSKIDQIVIEVHDKTRATVELVHELLVARGFQCAVVEEELLQNSGLFNIYARRKDRGSSPETGPAAAATPVKSGLQQHLGELCAAAERFARDSRIPLLLAVAPRTPRAGCHAYLSRLLERAEQELMARASLLPQVTCIRSDASYHPSSGRVYFDEHSYEQGHIPYTAEGFAAIGTALFRASLKTVLPVFKVLVLDCDETLWQGVCAEDGPDGVKLTPGHRALQELALQKMNSGLLLCLCSKNQEQDVWDVFARRPEMPLRREHLTSWRINWDSKAENLRSLSKELGLGLESFIFIDDNPVECAQVRARCPEAVVLQLPRQWESIPTFLQRIWIFDRVAQTEVDRRRTAWYQENAARERFRQAEPSMKRFIEGLQLRVQIQEAADEQLPRVSQLTLRTNQFNFTQFRRSESELRTLLRTRQAHCLTAEVQDRFGDYGLVGTLLYSTEPDGFVVDTFLLSCRVLGRGVEHQMAAELGRRAVTSGRRWIELPLHVTAKNRPALDFVNGIKGGARSQKEEGKVLFRFDAETLAGLEYQPEEKQSGAAAEGLVAPAKSMRVIHRLSEVMQRIGEDLYEPKRVLAAMHKPAELLPREDANGMAAPAKGLEGTLVGIWRAVLNRTDVRLDENFFEAGGTSLKAVLLVARIRKELRHEVTILNIFESLRFGCWRRD